MERTRQDAVNAYARAHAGDGDAVAAEIRRLCREQMAHYPQYAPSKWDSYGLARCVRRFESKSGVHCEPGDYVLVRRGQDFNRVLWSLVAGWDVSCPTSYLLHSDKALRRTLALANCLECFMQANLSVELYRFRWNGVEQYGCRLWGTDGEQVGAEQAGPDMQQAANAMWHYWAFWS